MNKKLQPITIEGTLAEMSVDNKFSIKVPTAKGVDIKALIKSDADPMFVVVEALNDGVSKNNRKYSKETVASVATQINSLKPDAYQGHLTDEERPFANPDSKTIWVGAKVLTIDGKDRLFVKGYIMPYATELKQYLRAAKAVTKKVAVSIYGRAEELLNASGIKEVMNFKLESIDWARGSSAGIATLGYMSITREMEDNMESGDYMKVIENYETIREIAQETAKTEIVKEQGSNLSVVAEMLNTTPAQVSTVVSEMVNTIAEQERKLTDYTISEMLSEKLPTNSVRKVAKTLVLAEMEKGSYNRDRASIVIDEVLKSETMENVVSEMSSKLDINPRKSVDAVSRSYTTVTDKKK